MTGLMRWLVPAVASAALAFVLQTSPVMAQDAAAPAAPAAPTTQPTGSVKVTVTGEDGKPAANVTVTVSRRGGRRGGGGGGGGGGAAGGGDAAAGGAGAGGGGGGGGRRGGGRGGPPIATGTTDASGVVTLSSIPVSDMPYAVAAVNADMTLRGRGMATVVEGAPVEVAITLAAGRGGRGGGGGGAGGGAGGGGAGGGGGGAGGATPPAAPPGN